MTSNRWRELMSCLRRSSHKEWCRLRRPDNTAECDCGLFSECELTEAELAEGWHWCCEWDGLLVGPGMRELESCTCRLANVYGTV